MSISENLPNISATPTDTSLSIFSMLHSADVMSKLVMLILLIASVWSWAIILDKLWLLSKVRKKIQQFESMFWSGQVLDQLYEAARRNVDNPLSNLFVNAMTEFKRQNNNLETEPLKKLGLKERIAQSMQLIREREVEKLDKGLDILSIIGSNALFVGLFGTVWGIMHSFQSIAGSNNTSLAVVAPGIAEALLATAIGLVAAIPCVVFSTYLSSKINQIYNKMEDFSGELNNILSRVIDEGKA